MDRLMILRTAWRSLTVNKMRSVLTALGIIIGVGSVILMIALSQGATAGITDRISSMGSNLLMIYPGGGRGAMRGAGLSTLKMGDAEAIASLPFVKSIAPEVSSNASVQAGSLTWQASISGTTPAMVDIKGWDISEGSFFTKQDNDNRRMVAVLGQTVVDNLFTGNKNPLGATISINNLQFTVIGIIPSQGGSENQDNTIYMPLTTAQQRLTGGTDIRTINVQATKAEALPFLKTSITSLLRERHRLAANAEDDFRIMDMAELLATVEDTTKILSLLLGGIAAVSLIVGGIGVMNIMLVSVTERTREIGIRMAVGARTRDILAQFLVESILLCSIGGAIGCALGWGLAKIFGIFTSWTMAVPPWSVALSISFSLAVGIVFGYYPAKRAADLNPIEALRYE
ncbi:MAG: ABC transporter permease [Methylocystaceae bacterium]